MAIFLEQSPVLASTAGLAGENHPSRGGSLGEWTGGVEKWVVRSPPAERRAGKMSALRVCINHRLTTS